MPEVDVGFPPPYKQGDIVNNEQATTKNNRATTTMTKTTKTSSMDDEGDDDLESGPEDRRLPLTWEGLHYEAGESRIHPLIRNAFCLFASRLE